MPSSDNICAPINIHGIGRSGTTLLQNLLAETGHVQVCNETGGMIFSCYRGGEVALLSDDTDSLLSAAELPATIARVALCVAMPSRKRRWCQKLGGIPNHVVWSMTTTADRDYASQPYPFPYEWYWHVLRDNFPASRDVLILRDYRDIIVSRYQLSGWPPADMAAAIAVYFNLMAHPMAKIDHVVLFRDLVSHPEATVTDILAALGIESELDPLKAMSWYAAPSGTRDLAEAAANHFSWDSAYSELITDEIKATVAHATSRLEQRFGLRLANRE